jgi:hypothetical protein
MKPERNSNEKGNLSYLDVISIAREST